MARKKEYSIADGCAKKRTQSNFTNVETLHKPDTPTMNNPSGMKRKDSSNRAGPSCSDVYDVADLRAQLGSIGLTLRDIPGDGNCLFRALGDQYEGHSRNHMKHRMDTVRYMIAHRKHFEPFIDIPFERYIDNLSRPGTYAGQDALVAFARLHQVNIVIHQLNSPLWQIEGSDNANARELHLSYHNGEHYSSVRYFGDLGNTPAHVRLVSLMGAEERPCCVSLGKESSNSTQGSVEQKVNTQRSSTFSSHGNEEGAPLAIPESIIDENNYVPDDFGTLIDEVMMRSNCRDRRLASEALFENDCDVEQTIDYLISLSVAWEDSQKSVAKEVGNSCSKRNNLINREPRTDGFEELSHSELHPSSRTRRQSVCSSKERDDGTCNPDLRFLTL